MKKILIVLISLSFVFSLEVLGQKKSTAKKPKSNKAQPVPKVSSGGQKEKEFVSTEGKFKILFPAPPVINVSDGGTGDLRLRSVSHRALGGTIGF